MRVVLIGHECYCDIGDAAHHALDSGLQLAVSGVGTVVVAHGHPGQPEKEEISGVRIKRLGGLVLNSPTALGQAGDQAWM
jgi:hypothetical protein